MEFLNFSIISNILSQEIITLMPWSPNGEKTQEFQKIMESIGEIKNNKDTQNLLSILQCASTLTEFFNINNYPLISESYYINGNLNNQNLIHILKGENLTSTSLQLAHQNIKLQDIKKVSHFVIEGQNTGKGISENLIPWLIKIEDYSKFFQKLYDNILTYDFSNEFQPQDSGNEISNLLIEKSNKIDVYASEALFFDHLKESDNYIQVEKPISSIQSEIKIDHSLLMGNEDSFLEKISVWNTKNDRIFQVSEESFQNTKEQDSGYKKYNLDNLTNSVYLDSKKTETSLDNIEKQNSQLGFELFNISPKESLFPESPNMDHKKVLLSPSKKDMFIEKTEVDIFSNQDLGDFQRGISSISPSNQTNLPSWSEIFYYKEIYQQIGKQVFWCLKNDREKVKLILNPPELGQIQIEVKNSQKNVEIQLWADNADTKQLLELNRDFLTNILTQDGFKLERLIIYFHQNMTHFQDRNDQSVFKEKDFRGDSQEDDEINGVQEEGPNESYYCKEPLWGIKHIDLKV